MFIFSRVEWCPGAELNHRHADFQSKRVLFCKLPQRQIWRDIQGLSKTFWAEMPARFAGTFRQRLCAISQELHRVSEPPSTAPGGPVITTPLLRRATL